MSADFKGSKLFGESFSDTNNNREWAFQMCISVH